MHCVFELIVTRFSTHSLETKEKVSPINLAAFSANYVGIYTNSGKNNLFLIRECLSKLDLFLMSNHCQQKLHHIEKCAFKMENFVFKMETSMIKGFMK